MSIPIQALAERSQKELDEAKNGTSGNVTLAASNADGAGSAKADIQGVFVVRSGKAQFVPVQTGISGVTDIEITSGLHEGDVIVTGSLQGAAHAEARRVGEGRQFHTQGRRVVLQQLAPYRVRGAPMPMAVEEVGVAELSPGSGRFRRGHPDRGSLEDLRDGHRAAARPAGREHRDPQGRVRRHHGSFRLGQIHADEFDRLPGFADQGKLLARGTPREPAR